MMIHTPPRHLDVVPDPVECQGLVIQPHVAGGLLTAEVEEAECSHPVIMSIISVSHQSSRGHPSPVLQTGYNETTLGCKDISIINLDDNTRERSKSNP